MRYNFGFALYCAVISILSTHDAAFADNTSVNNNECHSEIAEFTSSSNSDDANKSRYALLLCLVENAYAAKNLLPLIRTFASPNKFYKVYPNDTEVTIGDDNEVKTKVEKIYVGGSGQQNCACDQANASKGVSSAAPRGPIDPLAPWKSRPAGFYVDFNTLRAGPDWQIKQLKEIVNNIETTQPISPYATKFDHLPNVGVYVPDKFYNLSTNQSWDKFGQSEWLQNHDWVKNNFTDQNSGAAVMAEKSLTTGCCCNAGYVPMTRSAGDVTPSVKYENPAIWFNFDQSTIWDNRTYKLKMGPDTNPNTYWKR